MSEQRWLAVVDAELIGLLVDASFDEAPQARFWAKVDKRGDCWIWTGALSDEGYGNFSIALAGRRRVVRAHRVAWFFYYQSAIDPTHYLDHYLTPLALCVGRFCVNPTHLEPVPKHVNDARAAGATPKATQRYRRQLALELRDAPETSPALAGATPTERTA